MYNWYILKSISRYWSQICHYLISNLFTCNFLSINIKFLQQDRLFSEGKMFRNEATSAPKSIWRSERRCYSNDIITNDARDSYRLLKDCWRIRNQQSNHVFDNDSYRPRDTMIGFYVPESPVAGRFPLALLLVHQQPSLYVVVGVSLSLSLSLSLSKERGYGRDFHGHPYVFQWPIVIVSWLMRNKIAWKPILLYRESYEFSFLGFLRKFIHVVHKE